MERMIRYVMFNNVRYLRNLWSIVLYLLNLYHVEFTPCCTCVWNIHLQGIRCYCNDIRYQLDFLTRPAVNIAVNKIDIIVTSSTIVCDVISRTETERVRHGDDVLRSSFLSSFMDSLCRVRNKIMYVLSWRTVSVPTNVILAFISLVASQLGK